MTDDRYDDGLVHSHGWATQPPAHLQAQLTQQQQARAAAPGGGEPDDSLPYDDGLVHSHNWASGDYAQSSR